MTPPRDSGGGSVSASAQAANEPRAIPQRDRRPAPGRTRACPVCGGVAATEAFRARDVNHRLSPEVFEYRRCSSCRTMFVAAIPDDLDAFYPSSYYAIPESVEQLAAAVGPERYKIETILRYVRRGRLLEIGPGVGGFAYLARDAGFEVEVIEMDRRCCAFLRDAVGVRTTESADPRAALERSDRRYEVVALWHVVEHLPDPVATITAAASRLAPGGVLVLAAPNPGSLQFRLLRGRWAHVDAPRHLQLIPLSTVRSLAARLGLHVAQATTRDAGALFWNRFGWQESLANVAVGGRLRPRLRRLGVFAGRAADVFERRDELGSTYTVVLGAPGAR